MKRENGAVVYATAFLYAVAPSGSVFMLINEILFYFVNF